MISLEVFQELAISAARECGPWCKTPLPVELKREIDIRFAIQKISKVHSRPLQVYGVDLKVAPIEAAVGVVVIDLAGTAWILGALDCQSDSAIRPEFVTCVLLIRGQAPAELVGSNRIRIRGFGSRRDHHGRLEPAASRRSECSRVL